MRSQAQTENFGNLNMERPVFLNPIAPHPHTHTIVFLHGRGSTASTLCQSLPDSLDSHGRNLRELFPSFRWVFPQAPISRPAAFPKDLKTQWFDVWDAKDLTDREDIQVEGLRISVETIKKIIAEETDKLRGHAERLILAGISQGASTAVHSLLHLEETLAMDGRSGRLGAFIGFCGRLPFSDKTLAQARQIVDPTNTSDDNEVLRNTPILLEHSINDPLAMIEDGRILRDALLGYGAEVTWKEYADGGHWIQSPQGIEDAADFLRRSLEFASTSILNKVKQH